MTGTRHTHIQRESSMETEREGGHLKASGRKPPLPMPDLGLVASRTVRHKCLLFMSCSLWFFVMAKNLAHNTYDLPSFDQLPFQLLLLLLCCLPTMLQFESWQHLQTALFLVSMPLPTPFEVIPSPPSLCLSFRLLFRSHFIRTVVPISRRV